MSEDIYVRLGNRLNQNDHKLPLIKEVLQLLKDVFSEQQAELGAEFPLGAHTLKVLAGMLARDEKELELLLEGKFRVTPANETDVHVMLPEGFNLDGHLCIKNKRTIKNDNTIAYEGSLYQLEESAGKKVIVEERLDGTVRIMSNGGALQYKKISERLKRAVVTKTDWRAYNRPPKPSKDHPWKRRWQTRNSTPPKKAYIY